jgi:hypothetical protein
VAGYADLTVLDIAASALSHSRTRLGALAEKVPGSRRMSRSGSLIAYGMSGMIVPCSTS